MKKLIIGAVVAAVILFIWQFLSWTALNIHASEFQYAENQDEILECLAGKLEDGSYFLPQAGADPTSEEAQEYMAEMEGKPWAMINYHNSFKPGGAMNFIRGFGANLFACLLLCWVLLKIPNMKLKDTLLITISIGLIGYSTITYTNGVWFETSTMGYLIDSIVSWGLAGVWLGWFLNR